MFGSDVKKGFYGHVEELRKASEILKSRIKTVEYLSDIEQDAAVLNYEGLKIYIPSEEMNLVKVDDDLDKIKNLNPEHTQRRSFRMVRMLEEEIEFVIIYIDYDHQRIYASRKRAMDLISGRTLKNLSVGELVKARIIAVSSANVLVEVDGIYTKIPSEEFSVKNIKEYLKPQSIIEAYVASKDSDNITLTLNKGKENIFEKRIVIEEEYKKLHRYIGEIKSIGEKDIYIELEPGILVICSYPTWVDHTPKVGESAIVTIKKYSIFEKILYGIITKFI